MLPQCNGDLFTGYVPGPGNPGSWPPIGLPSLNRQGPALEGVTCRECGDTLNLQYSFLIKLAFFEDVEKKMRLKSPKLHTPGKVSTCQTPTQKSGNPDTSNPNLTQHMAEVGARVSLL